MKVVMGSEGSRGVLRSESRCGRPAHIICKGNRSQSHYVYNPINSTKNSELYMQMHLDFNLCSDNHNQLNKVLVKHEIYPERKADLRKVTCP